MEKITMNAVDRIIAISRGEKPKEEGPDGGGRPKLNIQTAAALRTKTFAPLKYIVPGLIVEGLVLLAGKPKVRKSWMALDISLATAAGRLCLGERKPQQGAVLYLGLEDGERRLQRRIDKLLPTFGAEWPEGFMYETKWPRVDQGGVDEIDKWCEENPTARLVVIDVLARFRAPANVRTSAYAEDYAALTKLQQLAIKRSITVLVIHHTRKGDSEDPVEEISGTLGLSGCADAFLVLKRTGSGATLTGRGRDTEDIELAVQFGDQTCRWTILGNATEVHRSDQRSRVLAALEEATEGLSTTEIAAAAGLANRNAADALLFRMVKDGDIERIKRGRYCLPGSSEDVPENMRKMRKKERSGPKPLNEQVDNGQSNDLTHLTQVSNGEESAGAEIANADYLGPPGDNPADFLGDIPEFLDRRKQQARN